MDQTDGTDYIDQTDEIISCLCTNVPLDSNAACDYCGNEYGLKDKGLVVLKEG